MSKNDSNMYGMKILDSSSSSTSSNSNSSSNSNKIKKGEIVVVKVIR